MLAAIAKGKPTGDERAAPDTIWLPGRKNPVVVRGGPGPLEILVRLRDEAHRFAGEYRAGVDAKRRLTDRLAGVPGVGPATRRKLLREFGSVDRIASAPPDRLREVPGVSEKVALAIREALASRADAATAGESLPTEPDRR